MTVAEAQRDIRRAYVGGGPEPLFRQLFGCWQVQFNGSAAPALLLRLSLRAVRSSLSRLMRFAGFCSDAKLQRQTTHLAGWRSRARSA